MIVNVAGCGAMLKDYGHHWHDDRPGAPRAVRRQGEGRQRVSRRAGPHRRRRARSARRPPITTPATWATPRKFARPRGGCWPRFPACKLVDLPETELCCGAAGTYNLTEPEMAARLSRRKLENILSTGAELVVTANAGCLLQIAREARQQGQPLKIVHPMDVLD